VNLARCTPADEILVAYITDMTMQKKVVTKKRLSDFWSGKVHPRRENPGYAYDSSGPASQVYVERIFSAAGPERGSFKVAR